MYQRGVAVAWDMNAEGSKNNTWLELVGKLGGLAGELVSCKVLDERRK